MKTLKLKTALVLTALFFVGIIAKAQTISTGIVTGPFCQGDAVSVDFTVSSSFTPGNTFTLEMSDESGSFAVPAVIGTLSGITGGTITGNLPTLLTSGTMYRFRVTGNSPMVTGTDNGIDIEISGSPIDPLVFGSNVWNAYCYIGNNTNFALNSYAGMYTDANVSFNSSDLWSVNTSPSNATNTTYTGCTVPDNTHAVIYKREGFPCDYYTINIADVLGNAGHDDGAELFIDGVSVWSNAGCCQAHLAVWVGFLGASSTVEFRWREGGGASYGRVTFVSTPAPILSPAVTICAGATTTLTASGAVNYDWSTNTNHVLGATNTASIDVSPALGTADGIETYTVTTTDATTGCTVLNSVDVTISATPSTAVTPTNETYCQAGSVNAIATGAAIYSWSPLTDITINSPSGNDVTLTPSSTTVYTVTGNNGCSTNTATTTVTVIPASGDTAVYGANVWNAYCFNGNNPNLNVNEYRGFYSDASVSFDSDNEWNVNGTPSDASSYAGCDVGINTHSVMYKREGFPCGYYQVDVAGILGEYGHDDRAFLYIDDVLVWSNPGCCQAHIDVWTGYLGPTSRIKFYWNEGGGGSYGRLTLTSLIHPTVSPSATVCAGASTTVYASDAANYDWSSYTTYVTGPTNTSTLTVSPPLATPNSVETYTVSTTDAGTGCTLSNTVDVTIDPASNTIASPLADEYCSPGTVNATATGASTYSWSPMTDVTLNFPNGSDVDLTPTVTTTYTVTGTNGCSSTSQDVTITVFSPLGDTSVFGDGQWNVYCYDGNSTNLFANTYKGDYTEPNLTFSSADQWGTNGSPSDAPGYVGCPIGVNIHSVVYKRTNFDCGYYQINVAGTDGSAGHDDGARLFIDGVEVWNNGGCCASHINVWTGVLGPTTTIDFRWREGGGGSYGKLHFVPLPYPTVTPDISTTPGSSETLTASGAPNYTWSPNTTYVSGGTNGQDLDLTIPPGEPGSIQTYTVSTTDASTGCVFSEDIIVTIISPLPVEFVDFNAFCLNSRTQVTWSTASERDNDYFTLEGSNDGINFTEITRISGNGTSDKLINYSTFINNVEFDYLRIKQTDFNGKFEYFKVVSNPACEDYDGNIQVIPNPNKGVFSIQISDESTKHEFRIVDIQGREVLRTNSTDIQLPQNIQPGIYLLESNKNGEITTVRFKVM